MVLTIAPSRPGLMLGALCIFLLQHIPLAIGHLRHGHYHQHHHHADEHDHSDNNHHRRTSSLESDFSPHHADIFDSCLVACYDDIVDRYGVEFAEQLKVDGFTYEECPNENSDHHTANNNSTDGQQQQQQRALNRLLGATNQLHRIWAVPSYRGLDGKLHIPYTIKTTDWFTADTLSTITKAMSHIEQTTGVIQFKPRTNETEYIYFNHEVHYEGVCAANLGRQTNTRTNVYLGWCKSERHLGNIVHELLHALGFWHEHSRPDRDEHVSINWDYVQSSARNNFAKATMVNSLGSPYDFNSIMHYPPVAFSTDRSVQTIIPVEPLENWETMGQRAQLSKHDVEQLRLLYQCASGPRDGGIAMEDLCSTDCPCWEHAIGECTSDDECMGDLICGETPQELPTTEYVDLLPVYTQTGGQFSCNDYCHANCCGYANAIIRCRETCDSAPPVEEPEEVPERMCVLGDGGSGSGGTSATTVATTVATTTSAETTTTTTSTASTTSSTSTTTTSSTPNSPPWYVDWTIDKCVQYCVGPAPCGGFGEPDNYYLTVQACCSGPLHYKQFQDCHLIPRPTSSPTMDPLAVTTESKSPSSFPSQSTLPSEAPVTEIPTYFPTRTPSIEPTAAPSHSPTMQPTKSPSQSPTKQPSNSPVIATTTTTAATTTTSETVSSSGDWYIDSGINKCVRDCVGEKPCRPRRKSPWQEGHATVRKCCRTMSYVRFKDCSYEDSMALRAGTLSERKWYPGNTKCLNDGNAPAWQHSKYSSQSTCCSSHFNWDRNNCMGITPAPSHKWYISWAVGKCVKDCEEREGGSCGGLVPGSWISKHDSAHACCDEHMSSSTIAQCKYN
mmetsp:Transcript_5331/g.12100  ORF Transcript_5331/g.12100 Transcript_5331/m.12100 type:complete len:842 (+) Transcript_5331:114-2639(+)|eukprot:CAMPEP_0172316478 /NCGR_PEP_ID=MMETSP1058-20130122/28374_1 /TAXON_ID=83371 /ORGANISM="Detonula confervacea, Strain CCMP 353" /LENGTH=841 /DNA_ID=CAMNT_0013030795 /DNA_START=110 /DNA_END=2635 /DNA_ORIENTATION=-